MQTIIVGKLLWRTSSISASPTWLSSICPITTFSQWRNLFVWTCPPCNTWACILDLLRKNSITSGEWRHCGKHNGFIYMSCWCVSNILWRWKLSDQPSWLKPTFRHWRGCSLPISSKLSRDSLRHASLPSCKSLLRFPWPELEHVWNSALQTGWLSLKQTLE